MLFLLLTACTNIPINQVNDRFSTWKSASIDELIKYWGIPTRKQDVGGKFYAEWLNEKNTPGNTALSVGSRSFGRHSSIGIGLTLFDLGSSNDACSRLVTYIDNGNVVEISWKGIKDYCYEITPDRHEIIKNKAAMEKNN